MYIKIFFILNFCVSYEKKKKYIYIYISIHDTIHVLTTIDYPINF